MELIHIEVNATEESVNEIPQKDMWDLTELQLALIGGGIADPVFA